MSLQKILMKVVSRAVARDDGIRFRAVVAVDEVSEPMPSMFVPVVGHAPLPTNALDRVGHSAQAALLAWRRFPCLTCCFAAFIKRLLCVR